MQVKQIRTDAGRQFVVVLDTGEEAVGCLLAFARKNDVAGGEFTALGAFEDAILGFFDIAKKEYERISLNEQTEVVSMVGNFATEDGEARLHPHVVVSKRDGSAWGGHLLEAHVRPTLEVVVTEVPAHLRRKTDPETGLPLLSV